MRFLTRLATLFYLIVITSFCGAILLFVLQIFNLEAINNLIAVAYNDVQMRAIVGLIAVVLIGIGFMFAKFIVGSQVKEKTIAFDNPSGQVSISLSAMEDMVRRLIYTVPEVKEVRPNIRASKKGLEVESRLILNADVNIPNLTAKLQDLVKNKILNTIGIEENVIVRIHVTKIMLSEAKSKQKAKKKEEKPDDDDLEPNIPFHGYRA